MMSEVIMWANKRKLTAPASLEKSPLNPASTSWSDTDSWTQSQNQQQTFFTPAPSSSTQGLPVNQRSQIWWEAGISRRVVLIKTTGSLLKQTADYHWRHQQKSPFSCDFNMQPLYYRNVFKYYVSVGGNSRPQNVLSVAPVEGKLTEKVN